jgi:hypothetical protein
MALRECACFRIEIEQALEPLMPDMGENLSESAVHRNATTLC